MLHPRRGCVSLLMLRSFLSLTIALPIINRCRYCWQRNLRRHGKQIVRLNASSTSFFLYVGREHIRLMRPILLFPFALAFVCLSYTSPISNGTWSGGNSITGVSVSKMIKQLSELVVGFMQFISLLMRLPTYWISHNDLLHRLTKGKIPSDARYLEK